MRDRLTDRVLLGAISILIAGIAGVITQGWLLASPQPQSRELRLETLLLQQGTDAYVLELNEILAFVNSPEGATPEVRRIIEHRIPTNLRVAGQGAQFIGGTQTALLSNQHSEVPVVGLAIQTPRIALQIFLPAIRDTFEALDQLRKIADPDLVLVGSVGELGG